MFVRVRQASDTCEGEPLPPLVQATGQQTTDHYATAHLSIMRHGYTDDRIHKRTRPHAHTHTSACLCMLAADADPPARVPRAHSARAAREGDGSDRRRVVARVVRTESIDWHSAPSSVSPIAIYRLAQRGLLLRGCSLLLSSWSGAGGLHRRRRSGGPSMKLGITSASRCARPTSTHTSPRTPSRRARGDRPRGLLGPCAQS